MHASRRHAFGSPPAEKDWFTAKWRQATLYGLGLTSQRRGMRHDHGGSCPRGIALLLQAGGGAGHATTVIWCHVRQAEATDP